MTMTVLESAQGLANPDRPEAKWDESEREPGLLVRIQMRMLVDPAGKAVTDTDARYWMRWDRRREFWTVRTTARSGKATRTTAQFGIREAPSAAQPRPALEVADISQSQAAMPPRRWNLPPEGYLSQAEAFVLPRLLPRATKPAEYGFYWFETRSARIAQRVDEFVPTGDGTSVRSRRSLEGGLIQDAVDPRGIIRSRTTDDGATMEATTGEELLSLWKRKGLPVE